MAILNLERDYAAWLQREWLPNPQVHQFLWRVAGFCRANGASQEETFALLRQCADRHRTAACRMTKSGGKSAPLGPTGAPTNRAGPHGRHPIRTNEPGPCPGGLRFKAGRPSANHHRPCMK